MGLAAIPVAITAIAAVATTVAAAKASQAQNASARYNAKMQEYNAAIQQQEGQLAASEVRRQGDLVRGQARAAAAASGLEVSGSFMDIDYDSLVNNEQAALNTKYRGDIGAYSSGAEAALSSSRSSGGLGLAGTLLSGGANIYGAYQNSSGGYVRPIFGSSAANTSPSF